MEASKEDIVPKEYEPLRKNRFLFRFPSDLGVQKLWVSSGSRPSISQTETEIPFLNTSNESVTITLKDPLDPSASQAVMEWICRK